MTNKYLARALAILAVAVGLSVALFPGLTGMSSALATTLGIVIIIIGLWATAVVPAYFTSVLFLFLAIATGIAPASVVFSGFHSSASWLIFGGLILGAAVQQSGLGERVVRAMLADFRLSYRGLIWAVALVGAALAFLIPSAVGRVMLLMPLVLVLADRLGFDQNSEGRTGIVLAAGMGTTLPAFAILPSNVPNIGMIGAAESIYAMAFTYGEYFLLNYPVLGVFSLIAVPILILRLYPDRPHTEATKGEVVPWTPNERRLLAILTVALALWVTDFVHHISPAWVALCAAIVAMLPRVGVLPPTVISKGIDYGPWIFVAGVVGMGAVVTHTGLGTVLATTLLAAIHPEAGGNIGNFYTLFGFGTAVALVTTMPASPAIMTPMAEGLAAATGWPLYAVLYMQVPTWILFPLPYMAPPLVVTLALGNVPAGRAARVLMLYFAVGVVVALPLQYLWGRFLGVYP